VCTKIPLCEGVQQQPKSPKKNRNAFSDVQLTSSIQKNSAATAGEKKHFARFLRPRFAYFINCRINSGPNILRSYCLHRSWWSGSCLGLHTDFQSGGSTCGPWQSPAVLFCATKLCSRTRKKNKKRNSQGGPEQQQPTRCFLSRKNGCTWRFLLWRAFTFGKTENIRPYKTSLGRQIIEAIVSSLLYAW